MATSNNSEIVLRYFAKNVTIPGLSFDDLYRSRKGYLGHSHELAVGRRTHNLNRFTRLGPINFKLWDGN